MLCKSQCIQRVRVDGSDVAMLVGDDESLAQAVEHGLGANTIFLQQALVAVVAHGTSQNSVRYDGDQRLLEEYRVRTEAMLNSLGEGLIVTNEHGDITTINSYALNALGFAEHELLSKWLPK